MSRIGNRPVAIPSGVTVDKIDGGLRVKGPKGTLSSSCPRRSAWRSRAARSCSAARRGRSRARAARARARAGRQHGEGRGDAVRARARDPGRRLPREASGKKLTLLLGFSHPIEITVPEGLSVSVDRNVIVRIEGIDRRRVGQFAANLRALRPPEPYKGKGIRYVNEHVRRKVGKAAAGAAG
jgi:large subunit ribosomal protein L6